MKFIFQVLAAHCSSEWMFTRHDWESKKSHMGRLTLKLTDSPKQANMDIYIYIYIFYFFLESCCCCCGKVYILNSCESCNSTRTNVHCCFFSHLNCNDGYDIYESTSEINEIRLSKTNLSFTSILSEPQSSTLRSSLSPIVFPQLQLQLLFIGVVGR